MKKTSKLLAAAIAGIVGATFAASPLHAMAKAKNGSSSAGDKKVEKNGCNGGAGCNGKSDSHSNCAGKNDCKGKGGCKTDQHACKGMNNCKGQGGCKA